MTQVLVVYRRSTGELMECRNFGEDFASASRIRLEREMSERKNPDIEVVVLSSSSDDAFRQTHGRYFKGIEQLWAEIGTATTDTGVTSGKK